MSLLAHAAVFVWSHRIEHVPPSPRQYGPLATLFGTRDLLPRGFLRALCALSVWRYWHEHAAEHYPGASSILLLCDCGGSNNDRSNTFKYHLCELASELQMSIRVAHYPVYCSKYNPIERRAFAHVERSFRGRTFDDAASVAQAASETVMSEASDLTVTASVIETEFVPVRRSKTSHDLSELPITHDRHLPDYNYLIEPKAFEQ